MSHAYSNYADKSQVGKNYKIAIIGAGFAGLGMAARLKRRGETDFVVLERAEEVGGTWFENTYPGCACDVKSDLYSFSFAPNPDWSHRYARQPEILAYLKRFADDFGVRPHIRFNYELRRAAWDDVDARWQLETAEGPLTAQIPALGRWLEGEAKKFLALQVEDPVLRAQLTPDYRVGCKRILVSDDYYPALAQPNVELVTDAVARVEGNRFVTADAQERAFDVVVGATGFRATEPPIARVVYGEGGRSLADSWSGKLEALHGTTVAGFPNLFVLVGPNTGLGHNSIVYIIEAQIAYVLRALDYMKRNEVVALEPTQAAQTRYNARLQDQLGASVWTQGGCGSWYLDKHGRNTTLWPGWATSFRLTLRRFDPALYSARREVRPRGDRGDLGAPKAA